MSGFRARTDQSGQPWERRQHDRWYRPRRGVDRAERALRDRQRALSVVAACMRSASATADYAAVVRLGGLHAWIVLDGETLAGAA